MVEREGGVTYCIYIPRGGGRGGGKGKQKMGFWREIREAGFSDRRERKVLKNNVAIAGENLNNRERY